MEEVVVVEDYAMVNKMTDHSPALFSSQDDNHQKTP